MAKAGGSMAGLATTAAADSIGTHTVMPERVSGLVSRVQDYFLPVLIILWALGSAAIAALA
ncbi:hypothetical protein [Aurantiacibacter flavus]|uniref:L-lactate permease n=1 Tax=Aurantiacibacter flavus TaxID=3145232 RepID=A0ABV0CSD6_9SPHN